MNSNLLTSWRRLLGLLNLERKDVLQVLYYAIFAGIVSLSLPLGIQAIINLLQGAQISTSWVVLVILVSIGVVFVGILQLYQFRIIENIQQKLFVRASFDFTYHFPKIKMSELNGYYPPELANRFFDILTVQKALSKLLVDLPAALLQIVLGLILLSLYHPFFIIYGVLLVLLMYSLFRYTAEKGIDSSLVESKHKYKVAHWIQEVARSLVSFKISGATTLAMTKNDRLVNEYVNAREDHFKVLVFQFSKLILFKLLVTAGLLVIGGMLVLNQKMNIGQFVAAEIIILLIIGSVEKLIQRLESFYDILTSVEKLGQVLDKEIESQVGEEINTTAGMEIELDDIGYHSNGKDVLKDVSLKMHSGDSILINGPCGSGKSLLLKIIAGLEAPSDGAIYVNQRNLSGLHLNTFRNQIGISFLDETPFEGTLLENLTFGNPQVSKKEVEEVIKIMGLNGYVKELSKGLDSIIVPEGKQLPYTVNRKIILARALLKHPKWLILQDPFLNFEEEEARRLIDFLTHENRSWGIIVESRNPYWKECLNVHITLNEGQIV